MKMCPHFIPPRNTPTQEWDEAEHSYTNNKLKRHIYYFNQWLVHEVNYQRRRLDRFMTLRKMDKDSIWPSRAQFTSECAQATLRIMTAQRVAVAVTSPQATNKPRAPSPKT